MRKTGALRSLKDAWSGEWANQLGGERSTVVKSPGSGEADHWVQSMTLPLAIQPGGAISTLGCSFCVCVCVSALQFLHQ